MPLLHP